MIKELFYSLDKAFQAPHKYDTTQYADCYEFTRSAVSLLVTWLCAKYIIL